MYERDAWDEIGDTGNGIEGQHLKCAKGDWLLDGEKIKTGDDGLKIAVIMESAIGGKSLWQDGKIVERETGRIADGYVPPKPKDIRAPWTPYILFQGVCADEDHFGVLVTFTSSSFGGRFGFEKLINPWRMKRRQQFPICSLMTKPRGDINNNVDPIFRIKGWSNRSNFEELLPPPLEAPAIAFSPAPAQAKSAAEIIDDQIPF